LCKKKLKNNQFNKLPTHSGRKIPHFFLLSLKVIFTPKPFNSIIIMGGGTDEDSCLDEDFPFLSSLLAPSPR
jgi:hypothetical protein